MNRDINRVVGLFFLIFFVIVSSILYFSYLCYNDQVDKENWVFHTDKVILTSEKALSYLKDMETGQRGYIITSDSSFLKPYFNGKDSIEIELAKLKNLTIDNRRQRVNIDSLYSDVLERKNILENAIEIMSHEKPGLKRQEKLMAILLQGKIKMERVRNIAANIITEENHLLHLRTDDLENSVKTTKQRAYALGLIFIIYSVSSLFYISRLINKQNFYQVQLSESNKELSTLNYELRAINEELASANEEIASANEEIATANEELTAANEEISAANEEITAANEELTSINEELSSANEIIRKQGDDLIRQSEEKLNQLLNTIDDVAWSIDLNTRQYIFVSKSSETIFGYTFDELKESDIRGGLVHPDDRQITTRAYQEILEKKHVQFENRIIHKSGKVVWVNAKMSLAFNELGMPVSINGITSDITERKERLEHIIESEKNYKYLFENNPLPMWIYDVSTLGFLAVNNAAITKYGYSEEEFLNFNIKDIRPVEDKIETFIKSTTEPLNISSSLRHQKKNGELMDVEIFANIITYNGKNARLVLVNDITENKIAQSNLLHAYHELLSFQSALDSSALVSITDKEGRIIKVNKNFCEVSGYSEEELLGKTHKIINSKYHPKEFFKDMWDTISAGKVWSGEIKNKTKKRSIFWVSTVITPILDTNHNIDSYISIRFLITERKVAEIERELMADELIRRNQDLEHFAYITSHNLRAPLANILGLTKIFNKTNPNDPVNVKTMDKLEIAGTNLDMIINDMNYILSIRKDVNESKTNLYLNEMVNGIKESIENIIVASQAQVTYDFSQAPVVFAIKSYLHNIVINLLTNAIKYKAFDRTPEIHLNSYHDGRYTCLKVSDNGLGIDLTTQKEKIFKLYKRFHFHTEGKGMGLYLVKTQIEAMGGKITIESTVNEGTTFIVYFKQES